MDYINEHNSLSVEVHKLNMMRRRTAASCFIKFSLMKIISLHLMFSPNDLSIKILAINIFVLYFVFGLTVTYLFSLQIKSAHQSLGLIELIVCKCKMRLKLRLKVKSIKVKSNLNSFISVVKFH